MGRNAANIIVLSVLLTSALASTAVNGQEIETHYATLVYDNVEYLRQFNNRVLSQDMSCRISHHVDVEEADEARCRLDATVDRVEAILNIFPRSLHFTLVLLPSGRDVQNVYTWKYGKGPDYIGFYSPVDNTVYISANDVRIGVLAHELTHVILDKYFHRALPATIQEVIAHYVESQINH